MNKVVLVTGGAQGIGKAIVLELAKNHYDVVINYLTSSEAAALLEEEIKKNYDVRVMTVQADVSKEEEVDAMISLIEKQWGGVDILINNAAVDLSNLFHLKTADEFRKTLDVNVVGAFNCRSVFIDICLIKNMDVLLIFLLPMGSIPTIQCVLIMMPLKLH